MTYEEYAKLDREDQVRTCLNDLALVVANQERIVDSPSNKNISSLSTNQMFGVVLWSGSATHRAVVWCEDHGNLAFLLGDRSSSGSSQQDVALVPGDIVKMQLRTHGDMRIIEEIELLEPEVYKDISRQLMKSRRSKIQYGLNVIPFESIRVSNVVKQMGA
ncbi:hypothetical protein [Roseovarius indicus]|uniref:hypothetical protein n=1 Tax=Roseovarius indicus TaxID=540747 RepID=UPI0007DA1060|nr:hypothetical protein [Roseovarius indicus]OAO07565.1 hypothetical protein A8B76_17675 [Roseovarius indicus]